MAAEPDSDPADETPDSGAPTPPEPARAALHDESPDDASTGDTAPRPRKRGPRPGKGRNPMSDVTYRRRNRVEKLWVEGMNLADIVDFLNKELGETFSRQTYWKDLQAIRARWEAEGKQRSRDGIRGELERMSRRVFVEAMAKKKTVVRRTTTEEGKQRIETVIVPDPDFNAANRAVERIAALHGLNVTTFDGTLTGGIAGLVGQVLGAAPASDEP